MMLLRPELSWSRPSTILAWCAVVLTGCSDDPVQPGIDDPPPELVCSLDERFLVATGVGRDGVPSLQNPAMTGAAGIDYVQPVERVVGVVISGQPFAIPHNLLWWHEIVNLDHAGVRLAITYCPLTGSALAFDRASIDGDELGVSGLLFQSNLIMYNRRTQESLWPQMIGAARCGPQEGAVLDRYPIIETSWRAWQAAYPETLVPQDLGDILRDFTVYPYGDYESVDSRYLYPMPALDARYGPKERVLGFPDPTSPRAVVFSDLEAEGTRAAINTTYRGQPVVVLWESEERSANAFVAQSPAAQPLTFEVLPGGSLVDRETGSRWRSDGSAVTGPLAGTRLTPVADTYVAFWGAWTSFFPGTEVWQADATSF